MPISAPALLADLELIRTRSPLILNLTNFVAMDFTANALLALGASPVMAHAPEELSEMTALAQAVVLNIGTLDTTWLQSMQLALSAAPSHLPVVLDPVGAGATSYRTRSALTLLEKGRISVVRGNASEISALFGELGTTKGVDSSISSDSAARALQGKLGQSDLVVAISGATDYVLQGSRSDSLSGGHPMMSKVTAMGCTATSLVGAFLAVNPSPFEAALHAFAVMGRAGELAGQVARGPGSFRVAFIDALANLSADDFQ